MKSMFKRQVPRMRTAKCEKKNRIASFQIYKRNLHAASFQEKTSLNIG